MSQRCAGDMQLGSSDHHAVIASLNYVKVGIGVGLFARCETTIALGVRDALHDSQVIAGDVSDIAMDRLDVPRMLLSQGRSGGHEGQQRLRRGVQGEVSPLEVREAASKVVCASRHSEKGIDRVGSRLVKAIIDVGYPLRGVSQSWVAERVRHSLTVEEHLPTVA
jgi:hypothetical protein